MTNSEIIAAAAELGITPTSAPMNSEEWERWAERVQDATPLGMLERIRAALSIDAKFAALRAALA